MKSRRLTSGFTLLELIITLLLITILSTIAISKWPDGVNLAAQAEQLVNDLRYTQSIAMTRGQGYRINFTANNYSITTADGLTSVPQPATGKTVIPLDTGITLSTFPTLIAFDKEGVPADSAGSLAAVATIILTAGTDSKTIRITPETGRLVIQ